MVPQCSKTLTINDEADVNARQTLRLRLQPVGETNDVCGSEVSPMWAGDGGRPGDVLRTWA